MSEASANIVVETALRILADHCTPAVINEAEAGHFPDALWAQLAEAGLPWTWVPEGAGGAGAEIADGFGVLRAAGAQAAPVPLAETLMAGFLLADAGLQVPLDGPMTVAPLHPAERPEIGADGRLRGAARAIPFARVARHLVVLARRGEEDVLALVAAADCAIAPGQSLAGEPRDRVAFDGAAAIEARTVPGLDAEALMTLGAAVRAMQMAGALERILNQSLQQATDRVQFGRPIGNFQVIQHSLAQLAGEVAAASAAADAAAEAIRFGPGALSAEAVLAEVATAKIRVGEAAGTGAAIAHQVHGAMGFTAEHTLHHATRRLWAWRDEFGDESAWAMRLGRIAARHGAEGLWPFVTGTAEG